jgi:hypothetical protein
MQNRLDELKAAASAEPSPANKKGEASIEMVKVEMDEAVDETMQTFQGIMAGIQKIEKNVETINALKQRCFYNIFSNCKMSIIFPY